jgi:hypothetical protein
LLKEKRGGDFLKKLNIIEQLTGEVSLDINILSLIMKKDRYKLRRFMRGESRLMISSDELELLVNQLVQSRIDDFIHQLDTRNITLAQLYRINRRL